ncbi:hypothetical protein HNP73_003897, partial [Amaricoccus macauensis]|nr:hypothetical protein [Amaricoccus macauensis]
MSESMHEPSPATVAHALVDAAGYSEMYGRSVSDPEGFWGEQGGQLDWI